MTDIPDENSGRGRLEIGVDFNKVKRAVRLTNRLNRLTLDDEDAIRAAWSELTGRPVHESFRLIPPVYSDLGLNIAVGRDVFINQGCTLSDIGGIEIGDEVMIGPKVNLISSGHPTDPARRRKAVTGAPIVVGRNVWIGTGATILQGVTIGADAVVAAGAVVTRDVPPATLVAGVPAKVVRDL
ncbi:MAG TPA: DapH/DapD/GlmU-related protein [Solirubrobacterales bacterium]|nr:DapH/DapD/GlmU-related protein [Solirubrobacterales bacterium]